MPATLEQARKAKQIARTLLENVPGLNGIGITSEGSGYAVKVNLNGMESPSIPVEIEGVPVKVETIGTIRKIPA